MKPHCPHGVSLSLLLLAALSMAAAILPARAEAPPAGSFQLVPPEGVAATTFGEIPPDGTIWREFYDRGGGWGGRRDRTQTAYADNGDLVISAGDVVSLDGVPYAVQGTRLNVCGWIRWSSYCPSETWWFVGDVLEFNDPGSGVSTLQIQELWLYRDFITAWWADGNGSHALDPGDTILWNVGTCYCGFNVAETYTSVILSEFGAVPVEPTTWGRLKTLF